MNIFNNKFINKFTKNIIAVCRRRSPSPAASHLPSRQIRGRGGRRRNPSPATSCLPSRQIRGRGGRRRNPSPAASRLPSPPAGSDRGEGAAAAAFARPPPGHHYARGRRQETRER
uniref:Uncharacterized protein n=1 Tax=Oryza glumipatula TaxID=40148 RepID=A0A0D9ZZB1_9ORYZ